jgi:signal transduction histidine kinase
MIKSESIVHAKILIIDDQQANVDVLENLLELKGYNNFISTTDSREAFSLFMSYKPDLILLDLMMPFLNGFEIMELLKPIISPTTYLPILVLTADVDRDTRKKALSSGAKDFILKPFDLLDISLRVNNLLETRLLYLQQENQNQILEEKVKIRTAELENMNHELAIAKEKAEASDRLKTSFIQNISHEIRTPLNGIIGISEIIVDSDLSNEEKQEYIPILHLSSKRLINTITDYVDISMIMSNNVEANFTEIDLNDELSMIIEGAQADCEEKQLQLNLEIPNSNDQFLIKTDVDLFHKIFHHLLSNAVKFTTVGSITLGYAKKSNNNVEFFVKDTGVGISEEAQDKIFNFFMQEDASSSRRYEGSGLGLAIVNGYLSLLKGQLRLESTKGEGSNFIFTLPL